MRNHARTEPAPAREHTEGNIDETSLEQPKSTRSGGVLEELRRRMKLGINVKYICAGATLCHHYYRD